MIHMQKQAFLFVSHIFRKNFISVIRNIIFSFFSIDEPAEQSSHSFIQTEREAYPPPPSRVQLERTRGPADPDEDLDSGPGHRRSYSMPSERLEVRYEKKKERKKKQKKKLAIDLYKFFLQLKKKNQLQIFDIFLNFAQTINFVYSFELF